jgi:hypothetical protein
LAAGARPWTSRIYSELVRRFEALEVPAEWRQQLMVLEVEEAGLGGKGGGEEEAERGTDGEYVQQPAAEAETEAEEAPPRPELAGPRAGSRRARQRASGGAAASGINWVRLANRGRLANWGWLPRVSRRQQRA